MWKLFSKRTIKLAQLGIKFLFDEQGNDWHWWRSVSWQCTVNFAMRDIQTPPG